MRLLLSHQLGQTPVERKRLDHPKRVSYVGALRFGCGRREGVMVQLAQQRACECFSAARQFTRFYIGVWWSVFDRQSRASPGEL